jgi:Cullin family
MLRAPLQVDSSLFVGALDNALWRHNLLAENIYMLVNTSPSECDQSALTIQGHKHMLPDASYMAAPLFLAARERNAQNFDNILAKIVDAIQRAKNRGHAVLLYDRHGNTSSIAAALAYMMLVKRFTLSRAIATLARQRQRSLMSARSQCGWMIVHLAELEIRCLHSTSVALGRLKSYETARLLDIVDDEPSSSLSSPSSSSSSSCENDCLDDDVDDWQQLVDVKCERCARAAMLDYCRSSAWLVDRIREHGDVGATIRLVVDDCWAPIEASRLAASLVRIARDSIGYALGKCDVGVALARSVNARNIDSALALLSLMRCRAGFFDALERALARQLLSDARCCESHRLVVGKLLRAAARFGEDASASVERLSQMLSQCAVEPLRLADDAMAVRALSSSLWVRATRAHQVRLPLTLDQHWRAFESLYVAKHPGRTLALAPQYGSITVRISDGRRPSRTVSSSTANMLVLMHAIEESARGASFTFGAMRTLSSLPRAVIVGAVGKLLRVNLLRKSLSASSFIYNNAQSADGGARFLKF